MGERLPLTSLLSQVLVALTIETDNEYEHRAPSVTADFGVSARGPGPWLISTAMYVNFLRLVPEDGVRMGDLAAAAGSTPPVHPAFHGMRRWGFVRYAPDISGSPRARDADAVVYLTPGGAHAKRVWAEVFDDVETRWSSRGLDSLRTALVPIAAEIDRPLPEYFPVLGVLLDAPNLESPVSRPAHDLGRLALLSQVSLAMTYEVEAASPWSLAATANLLRPLGAEPIDVRDLPKVSSVAKMVWSSAVGQLTKAGLVVTGPASSGRGKSVQLTAAGVAARDAGVSEVDDVEARWRSRHDSALDGLRRELEAVVGDGRPGSPLFAGLRPYPDGWRAKRPVTGLPHQPIPLHRGGYPDGS